MKHTPGPWHRNIKPASKYNTVFAGRNQHIAHLHVYGLSDDELEANCNLIAAAPELLKALKLADVLYSKDLSRQDRNDCIDEIRKAIAKAEGK